MLRFNQFVCVLAVCTCVVAQGSHEVIVDQTGNTECVTSTFEGGGQGAQIHPENGFLIPGSDMRFPGWLTLTFGNFANNPSGVTIAFWAGPPQTSREVTFATPVSSVRFFYAHQATTNGPPSITLDAFDAAGNLVATASAPGNVVGNKFNVWDQLCVDVGQNRITRVRVTGFEENTAIDDFAACRIVGTPPEGPCSASVVEGDPHDDETTLVLAFDPAASGVINIGCQQIPVQNGQIIDLECDDDDCTVENLGILEIETVSAVLVVTGTDACGNVGTCTLDLCPLVTDRADPDD